MDDARPSVVLLSEWGPNAVLTDTDGASPDTDSVSVMLYAIGLLMRRAREARGWIQADLADACEMWVPVLSRIERARREPRLSLALTLCNLLGVRFSDVMRMAEDEAFPLGRGPWTDQPANLLGCTPLWAGDE